MKAELQSAEDSNAELREEHLMQETRADNIGTELTRARSLLDQQRLVLQQQQQMLDKTRRQLRHSKQRKEAMESAIMLQVGTDLRARDTLSHVAFTPQVQETQQFLQQTQEQLQQDQVHAAAGAGAADALERTFSGAESMFLQRPAVNFVLRVLTLFFRLSQRRI